MLRRDSPADRATPSEVREVPVPEGRAASLEGRAAFLEGLAAFPGWAACGHQRLLLAASGCSGRSPPATGGPEGLAVGRAVGRVVGLAAGRAAGRAVDRAGHQWEAGSRVCPACLGL